MPWQFEHIDGPYTLTEGPAWDGSGLLYTDIGNNRVLRFDPATRSSTVYRTGTNACNGLMFDAQGRLYGCEGKGRRVVRYEPDGSATVIADRFEGKRFNSPNDLAIDRLGRIWFTDPRYGDDHADRELDHDSVYRADPPPSGRGNWAIHRVTFDTTRPNGLLLSVDEQTLYVAQSDYGVTAVRQLRAYPVKPDGSLGAHRVLHDFGPDRGIDGMCLDTGGNILAATGWQQGGPGPCITVFDAAGNVLERHPVPVDRPTNCTFGGADLRTLYVTTIGGWLFRVDTDRRGRHWWPSRA